MAQNNQQIQTNDLGAPEMPQPAPAPAPRRRGRPVGSGRGRGRPVGSGARQPRPPVPPPRPPSSQLFYGGDSQDLTFMLKRGEDLADMLISVASNESRVLQINSAQGRLSLVTLAAPNCASPISYEGQWEMLSLTGVYVPGNNVGRGHPIGGVSISFIGRSGVVIQGRIVGPVIVDTAVVVCMTAYNLNGGEKPRRKRRAGPRAANPVASNEGALPVAHETLAGGEEQAPAGPSNAGHGVGSDQEGIPPAGPSNAGQGVGSDQEGMPPAAPSNAGDGMGSDQDGIPPAGPSNIRHGMSSDQDAMPSAAGGSD
ncbi:PPC domain [Dillenia turbinata]|uniref:AT-hook motif nuclear-localized protein n=1 Tax=Dillenia turbinata TaxID=194707 RepID=A0AAN8UWE4_9MAGN